MPFEILQVSLRPTSFHLIQSDGCENRVFLGNTDSQIVQLGSREGIYCSKSKGNEKRPTQSVITLFLRWGIEFQSLYAPSTQPSYVTSKSFRSWKQPARFSSNEIESASVKLMLSHLQTSEMIGYKLLGLPFDVMKCKSVQS